MGNDINKNSHQSGSTDDLKDSEQKSKNEEIEKTVKSASLDTDPSSDAHELHVKKELKGISDDLLKRYNVKDQIGNHHELISDFLSSQEMKDFQAHEEQLSFQDGRKGKDKWGKLWESIPSFSSGTENKL